MARKMKDSGIEWIGEIPEGWELTKVKRIFDIGRGRVISQQELTSVGYPVYSSQTKNNGCLGYISTYDFDKSQLTWTTDGVNCKRSDGAGGACAYDELCLNPERAER